MLIFCVKLALFLSQMLSEAIMHECVFRLLRSPSDEESLECFARLITTTGKDLDHPQAKVRGRGRRKCGRKGREGGRRREEEGGRRDGWREEEGGKREDEEGWRGDRSKKRIEREERGREEGRGRRKDRGDKEQAKGEVPGGNTW